MEENGEMTILGTYKFCEECPTSGNCCSRVRPNGEVDSPVLFPKDLEKIEEYTGENINSFSLVRNELGDSLRFLKTGTNGCYFHQEGKCGIYQVRPLDCRLFPLDVIKTPDGRIALIAYTRLCPVGFDPKEHIEQAKKLLPELGENIYAYAGMDLPGMDKEPYIELEDLGLRVAQSSSK